MVVRVGIYRKMSTEEFMLLNCGVEEDSWESLGLQGDQISQSWRKWVLDIHWKDWCWSWNSNTLATWCKELTHLKRPWCLERLRAGGEGDDRGWDGWLSSPTRWTEFEQDPAIGDGQGSLACCSPQSHNELDMTEQLNWIELTSFYLTPSWEKLPCQKLCSVFRAACVQGLVNTEIQRPDWLLYLGWGSL